MLANIDAVVARMKQSQIYRSAGDIFILWGALQGVRESMFHMFPKTMATGWFAVDFVGIVPRCCSWSQNGGAGARFPYRLVATFAMFYGFGWVWADLIGEMKGRQLSPSADVFPVRWCGGRTVVRLGVSGYRPRRARVTLASYFWGGDTPKLW